MKGQFFSRAFYHGLSFQNIYTKIFSHKGIFYLGHSSENILSGASMRDYIAKDTFSETKLTQFRADVGHFSQSPMFLISHLY
jgi:hypothetical protein